MVLYVGVPEKNCSVTVWFDRFQHEKILTDWFSALSLGRFSCAWLAWQSFASSSSWGLARLPLLEHWLLISQLSPSLNTGETDECLQLLATGSVFLEEDEEVVWTLSRPTAWSPADDSGTIAPAGSDPLTSLINGSFWSKNRSGGRSNNQYRHPQHRYEQCTC